MTKNQSVVWFDNKSTLEQISNKLKEVRDFSDKEIQKESVRKQLIFKLGLLDNTYWKNFRNEIFNYLQKNSYVVVKDLPFDENNKLSVGLSSTLGNPIIQYNKKIPKIVHEIRPRTGPRYDENFPHTDGVYWPNPNDVLVLQCIKKDQNNGGLSRIVSVDSALESLKTKGSLETIKKLFERKFPFSLDPRYGNSGMHMQNILTRKKYAGKYHNHVRFLRHEIQHCAKEFHVHLRKATLDAVLKFEKEVIKLGEETQFQVNTGDWLIVDNKRALHSRSPTSSNSKRLLRRIKLNLDREKVFRF